MYDNIVRMRIEVWISWKNLKQNIFTVTTMYLFLRIIWHKKLYFNLNYHFSICNKKIYKLTLLIMICWPSNKKMMNITLIFNRLLKNTNLKWMKYCNVFKMEICYLLYLEYRLKKRKKQWNKKKLKLYFVDYNTLIY